MKRFSIIVPLLSDRRLFDDTLASVLRYRPESTQIIVVHDGTYDDPYGLDGEVEFISTSQRGQLIRYFNVAMQQATGELVALIRPGMELDEGWETSIRAAFEDPQVGSATPIVVAPGSPQTMVAAGVKKTGGFRRQVVGVNSQIAPRTLRRTNPLGPTSWVAFYRRSALELIGVLDEQLDPGYLDLEIALSLKTLGFQNQLCPECVVFVERAMMVARESNAPHGKSAQRAFRRHVDQGGTSSPWVQSCCVLAQDVLMTPLQPWRLQHAVQRLAAWRMARLDRNFADQLAIRAGEKRRLDQSGLRVHELPAEQISLDRVTTRRAA